MTKAQKAYLTGMFIGVTFCIMVTGAIGETVTVSWDQNSEEDLSGYKIYYGTSSGSYNEALDVGNKTSFIINNLVIGTTYFFAVTAYDFSGNESNFSNEVNFTPADSTDDTPEDPPVDPPTEDSVSFNAYCFPNPFSSQEGTTITLSVSDPKTLSIDIYTVTGVFIRSLIKGLTISGGEHSFKWDGKDQYENLINPGIYYGSITLDSLTTVIKMAIKP